MSSQNQNLLDSLAMANVIIINDYVAVALKYDEAVDSAPIIVAKGANEMALYIRKIASDNGVNIIQNELLALSLYKTVDKVGDPIPEMLYAAVAENFLMVKSEIST